MCKEILITGVKVSQQMSKARNILNSQIIPREELFQIRKKEGKLSPKLIKALKTNAWFNHYCNSKQNEIYTNLMQIEKSEIILMTEAFPDYFKHRLPDIYKLIWLRYLNTVANSKK